MRNQILIGVIAATLLASCTRHDERRHHGDLESAALNGASATTAGLPPLPGTGDGSGGAPDAGAASAVGSQLQPGLWETTLTINSVKAINEPDVGATDAFGDVPLTPSAGPRQSKVCLSAEEAAKGAPTLMSGTGLPSCHWEKHSTPPGTVSGTLVCTRPDATGELRADVTGAQLPSLFGTQLHVTIGDPAGAHLVSEAMMQGERVGDCPADGSQAQ